MRFDGYFFNLASRLCVLIVVVSAMTQCAVKPASELPKDILGISIGMKKDAAEPRLKEIAKLARLDRNRQQVWTLKSDARFGYLAVSYDKEDRIRYVTAFAKGVDATPVAPGEIGDISAAKQDMVAPNYRYTWQVAADGDKPAYEVVAQGSKPESLAYYSLSLPPDQYSDKDEEEEEKEK